MPFLGDITSICVYFPKHFILFIGLFCLIKKVFWVYEFIFNILDEISLLLGYNSGYLISRIFFIHSLH